MTRYLLLLSSIVSLFTLSWCISRWLEPAQCINSSLVGKVILEPEHIEVPQCSPLVRLVGPRLPNVVKQAQLPRRLENLEATARSLSMAQPDSIVKLFVFIHEDHKRQLLVTAGRIDISADLLSVSDLFEKTMLFSQFVNDTDFSAAVKSQFLFDETIGSVSHRTGRRPWVTDLQALAGYCHSNNVLVAHLTFCDAHNEYGDSAISDQQLGPTPWSLVPTFVGALETVYGSLSLKDKEHFLKNLLFLVEPDELSVSGLTNSKNMNVLDEHFVAVLRNWLMPLMVDESHVDKAVEYVQTTGHLPIRYVAVDRSARSVFPIDKLAPAVGVSRSEAAVGSPANPLTLIEYGIKKYVYPNDVGFKFDRKELFAKQTVSQLIYVSCDIPEVENLVQYGASISRVLFVRQCAEDDVKWPDALAQGVEHYLAAHSEVEFMEFNLSALRLAKKRQGPLHHPDQLANWRKWLKWQAVVTDDEEPSAMRPLAAIEGVRRFRIIH